MARGLVCPSCGRPIEWTAAFPFRPFCSERCRLMDLGAWIRGERAIPGESVSDLDTAWEAGAGRGSPAEPDEAVKEGAGQGGKVN